VSRADVSLFEMRLRHIKTDEWGERMKTIEVTKDCIKYGQQGSKYYCPIALAMRNAGLTEISVTEIYIRWKEKGSIASDLLVVPKNIKSFIKCFDKGQKVKPFEFELRAYKSKV
jgi:hypothetical protein